MTQTADRPTVRHRVRSLVFIFAVVWIMSGPDAAPPKGTASPNATDGVDLTMPEAGWGPERPMYRNDAPPSTAVMNSMIDDPIAGDERSFLALRVVGDETWTFGGPLQVQAGGRYEASISFHNDVRPDSPSVSRDTRVAATLPATVDGRERINAVVTSGTAEPPWVSRSLVIATLSSAVAIRIATETTKLYTRRAPAGIPVQAGELFSQRGVLVGCDGMTGDVTGEDDCRGEVRFQFVADQPNFTVTQRAAKHASNRYEYAPRATTGDELDLKIKYKNTGTVQQDNVVIKYELPNQLSSVPGTTFLANDATGGKWRYTDNDGVIRRGLNLGSHAPDSASYVRLTVLVARDADLRCGINQIVGTATAETENGSKSHQLTIEIERAC
jgi:uncharacterized repeat protein (TIGR01451 family)